MLQATNTFLQRRWGHGPFTVLKAPPRQEPKQDSYALKGDV
jgi:hypothetical protein